MDFGERDPPNVITDIIGNGTVTPLPDGLDVRDWEVSDRKRLAVVRIPPVAVPPCNT